MAEPLSATDRSSLAAEQGPVNMTVGGALIFEDGPGLGHDAILERVGTRLHLIPRYRQKLAHPAPGVTNPVWVDDESFDLAWHVRFARLPAPGGDEELGRLVGREMSRRLDRARPLWELLVVEGLANDRAALIPRMHHALVDGVATVDIGTVLLDPTPEPLDLPRARGAMVAAALRPHQAPRPPVAHAGRPRAEAAAGLGRPRAEPHVAAPGGDRPAQDHRPAHRAGPHPTVGADDVAEPPDRPQPPLRARDGPARRGQGHGPRARRHGQRRARRRRRRDAGPRAAADAAAAVRAGALLVGASGWAPPLVSSTLARAMGGVRAFNLVVSNIPGPQQPFWLNGRRLLAAHPVVPLNPASQGLSVGILSYDGQVCFGLLADRDLGPPLEDISGALRDALAELRAERHGV
jgi:diacylglycerol O-acyltransferase